MSQATETSFVLPSSPSDLKKIRQMLDEAVNCKIRIDGEKEAEKDIKKRIADEFELPKELINSLVKTMHKHNYSEVVAKQDDFQITYEKIMAAK